MKCAGKSCWPIDFGSSMCFWWHSIRAVSWGLGFNLAVNGSKHMYAKCICSQGSLARKMLSLFVPYFIVCSIVLPGCCRPSTAQVSVPLFFVTHPGFWTLTGLRSARHQQKDKLNYLPPNYSPKGVLRFRYFFFLFIVPKSLHLLSYPKGRGAVIVVL